MFENIRLQLLNNNSEISTNGLRKDAAGKSFQ